MEWSVAHIWLVLALILGVAELNTGGLVLLALGLAAAGTSLLAFAGLSLSWQFLGMGVLSGIMVPLFVWVIRPRFSPAGVSYGTTGTGVDHGKIFTTLKRDFDQATGIKINGDFYRLKNEEDGETEYPAGTKVVFITFDGTTAIVQHPSSKEQ